MGIAGYASCCLSPLGLEVIRRIVVGVRRALETRKERMHQTRNTRQTHMAAQAAVAHLFDPIEQVVLFAQPVRAAFKVGRIVNLRAR